jgi:diguanylate cyclase (GGDEF)-like protein
MESAAARDVPESYVSGSITSVVVRYVRRVAGDGGVQRMLEVAAEPRSAAEIEDTTGWSSYEAAVELFAGAAAVTGDGDVARRCGEEMLRQHEGSEVAALLRSLGSPGEVLRNVALAAAKFSTATSMEAVEADDDHAVITAWAAAGLRRDPVLCAFTAGLVSQAPVLFGMDPAVVIETQCQDRGDERCVFEVRWDPSSSPEVADPARRVAYLEAQLGTLTERFEALQETASELVSTEGVDQLLAAITRRAGLAVRATRYLLAVSLGPRDLRLHHQGFDDEPQARRAAEEVLAEHPDDHNGSRLIVDVASRGQRFGRLVALYPDGVRFFPAERRLLEAYAANAAAALGAATALEEARTENRTARALLALASSLATVGTSVEVARRLAEIVPSVVGCEHAAVLLWDPQDRVLGFHGLSGFAPDAEARLREATVRLADTPGLSQLLSSPKPTVVDERTADPYLRELLGFASVASMLIVPIIARGEFFGAVTASTDETARPSDDLLDRLTGMADYAATALQNARLLEQIRHQALHDALTGLPNRTLLQDRVDRALATASRNGRPVALLFVDLDNFKAVNDRLGHSCGDALLAEVARRLVASLRSADSAARVGGDEFVVLLGELTDANDAEHVADKLLDRLRAPLKIADAQLLISASIGVAVAQNGDDFETLLTHADTAMYHAKQVGRDTAHVYTP